MVQGERTLLYLAPILSILYPLLSFFYLVSGMIREEEVIMV